MKKKILTLGFRHETNAFTPAPADMQAYRNCEFRVGQEAFEASRGLGTEMGAFQDVLGNREDVELIPTVLLNATPSGPVTAEVYHFVTEEVVKAIRAHSPLDGIIINYHGAMVAEGHPDGEGDLMEIMRELVGWEIPIMASMDLHANVTAKMARCATVLVPYEEYPHTDMYETGLVTAQIMADTLDGKINPVMAYRYIPFLLPTIFTAHPPMRPLYDKAAELQAKPGLRCVRFAHGFFPADFEEMGMTVMAIADGDRELAEQAAEELAQTIRDNIPNLKLDYPTLDEALDRAILPGEGPVVLADASDNPGAGGLGDTTHILRRILERGITGAAVATIRDPESAAICAKAGPGATVELQLGGWSDPAYSGGPIACTAYVKMITDGEYRFKGKMAHGSLARHGLTAVVEIAGNTVLVTTLPKQPLDLEVFRAHGIQPEEQKILVTKSTAHYRADYGKVAREMIGLSLPGYAVPLPQGFAYKNWKGEV